MSLRNTRRAVSLLCALAACTPHKTVSLQTVPVANPQHLERAVERVVVLSIDGLIPETYTDPDAHQLRVPNLRRLVAEGAHSKGVLSVFPSVTYPAHTTIATGVRPGKHGVFSNTAFDPLDKNARGWRWYAEDIRVPTLWDAARRAGLRSALVWWPVSVAAKVDFLIPEYWRSGDQEEDNKLVRALSTPSIFELARDQTALWQGFSEAHTRDQSMIELATALLAREKPELLMVHVTDVDHAQHVFGPWSSEALAAIEHADGQLGALLTTLEDAQLKAKTALVVVSDHGFQSVNRQVHPGALLREAGLVQLDAKGKVAALSASVLASGGLIYVYLDASADAQVADKVRALFERTVADPQRGMARLYDAAQIAERGGDPSALLALAAQPGVWFGNEYQQYEQLPPDPRSNRGTHGYDPELPSMRASLLMWGAGVQPGVLSEARLIDVAPTIASWLDLQLPDAEGRVLTR